MAYIFQSVFASEFKNFLIMIRDAGQQTRGYEATFKSLDIFISENPVQGKALTEETISRWLDSLSCKPQSKNRRITHVRVFSRYLNALEIPAFEPGYMREQSEYIPYTFTDEETPSSASRAGSPIAPDSALWSCQGACICCSHKDRYG